MMLFSRHCKESSMSEEPRDSSWSRPPMAACRLYAPRLRSGRHVDYFEIRAWISKIGRFENGSKRMHESVVVRKTEQLVG